MGAFYGLVYLNLYLQNEGKGLHSCRFRSKISEKKSRNAGLGMAYVLCPICMLDGTLLTLVWRLESVLLLVVECYAIVLDQD